MSAVPATQNSTNPQIYASPALIVETPPAEHVFLNLNGHRTEPDLHAALLVATPQTILDADGVYRREGHLLYVVSHVPVETHLLHGVIHYKQQEVDAPAAPVWLWPYEARELFFRQSMIVRDIHLRTVAQMKVRGEAAAARELKQRGPRWGRRR
jgi:hypothetical protein